MRGGARWGPRVWKMGTEGTNSWGGESCPTPTTPAKTSRTCGGGCVGLCNKHSLSPTDTTPGRLVRVRAPRRPPLLTRPPGSQSGMRRRPVWPPRHGSRYAPVGRRGSGGGRKCGSWSPRALAEDPGRRVCPSRRTVSVGGAWRARGQSGGPGSAGVWGLHFQPLSPRLQPQGALPHSPGGGGGGIFPPHPSLLRAARCGLLATVGPQGGAAQGAARARLGVRVRARIAL